LMELKLLTVAARRADAAPPARGVSDSALRSEIQQLEGRVASRLLAHEKSVSEAQQATKDSLAAVHEQLAAVAAKLAEVQIPQPQPAVDVEALSQQIQARVQETIAAVTQQLSAKVDEQISAAREQQAADVKQAIASAHEQHSAQVKE